MKVIQLVQRPQLRGAEIFASQLANNVNQLGHNASIAFVFPGTDELPFSEKMFHLSGRKNRRLVDIKAWKKLAQIINLEKPDIIQANAGDTLKYAVFSKLFFRWKQPIVFRNASTISLYIKSSWSRRWNQFLYSYADKIISVSNTSATDFAMLFPKLKSKIAIIPIGIEDQLLSKNIGTAIEANPYKRKAGNSVIVHVGGFTYEKNHLRLIYIFEKILKINPNTELHLVGDGPLKSEIEKLVITRKLNHKITFHGFQKDALGYIKNADALILPSIIEGLPGVILEAFFCKTPVVAYDVGGIKEIVINEKTGFLIGKGEEEKFAYAVNEVVNKSSSINPMLDNAYQLVTTNYLNSTIAKKFLNIYTSILA